MGDLRRSASRAMSAMAGQIVDHLTKVALYECEVSPCLFFLRRGGGSSQLLFGDADEDRAFLRK